MADFNQGVNDLLPRSMDKPEYNSLGTYEFKVKSKIQNFLVRA
ncbi:MAG: hypothetical protein ACL9RN_05220 [Cylindrospermopsis raciborskii]|jgi:hypothetical protein|nr:hypothetical protein [Cylindrospermopsis raciborskii]